jgi:hypothetical protein
MGGCGWELKCDERKHLGAALDALHFFSAVRSHLLLVESSPASHSLSFFEKIYFFFLQITHAINPFLHFSSLLYMRCAFTYPTLQVLVTDDPLTYSVGARAVLAWKFGWDPAKVDTDAKRSGTHVDSRASTELASDPSAFGEITCLPMRCHLWSKTEPYIY